MPSEMETAFDNLVVTNIHIIDGLRGVLTFLVLWDHYHPDIQEYNFDIQADTFMFVIISGLTTALQLRVLPKFESDRRCHFLRFHRNP